MGWFQRFRKTEALDWPRSRASVLRAIALGAFALASGLVAACGHQVTPEPSVASSDLTGKVLLRFDTVGTLDFTNFSYAIILNTCGSGQVPYPNVYGTSFLAYSYGFFVGGGNGGSAQVSLWEFYFNNSTPTKLQVQINPSLIQFIPNSNGLGTEFELTFSRSLLNNPLHIAQPCPNVTQPPATPTPIATITATPTSGPTAAPTAGATSTPFSQPTTLAQSTWIFNYMTFTALGAQGGVPVDSLGVGGATDNTFQGVDIEVNEQSFNPIFRQTPQNPPSNQSAQIQGGEIDNYP